MKFRFSNTALLIVSLPVLFVLFFVFNSSPVHAESSTNSYYCPPGGTLQTSDGTGPTGKPSVVLSCSGGGELSYEPREGWAGSSITLSCPGSQQPIPQAAGARTDNTRAHVVCSFNAPGEPTPRPTIDSVSTIGPGDEDPDTRPEDEEEPDVDCDAGFGFTWIVCGLIRLIRNFVDFVLNDVLVPFLQVSPLQRVDDSGAETPQFAIWKGVRTIANALLIPAFLAMIFAQALSINIDAYTIKKALPRIAIVAILIQFSFYIVAIMVDITNVVGNGIGDLLLAPLEASDVQLNFRSGTSKAIVLGTTAIGAVTVVGTAFTGALFTALLGLVLAMVVVFLTLVFRQILVISLAIFAPVAFVAWVLPGTEKLAKIWWNLLTRALMMYPLIVILFAAGTLVATVASQNAGGEGVDDQGIGTVIAIGALVAPLAGTALTFKLAGAAVAGAAALFQKGRGVAMGGRDGRGGILARRNETVARRKREAQAGALTDTTGRFGLGRRALNKAAQFSTKPSSILPETIGGKRIPLMTKKGQKSRALAATGLNMASQDAAKEMQNQLTDVDALREFVENGASPKAVEKSAQRLRDQGLNNAANQLEEYAPLYSGSVEHRAGAAILLASQGKLKQPQLKALSDFLPDISKGAILSQVQNLNSRGGRKEFSRVISDVDETGKIRSFEDALERDENENFTGAIKPEYRGKPVEAEIQKLVLELSPGEFSQLDKDTQRHIIPMLTRMAEESGQTGGIRANPELASHPDLNPTSPTYNPNGQVAKKYAERVPQQRILEHMVNIGHPSGYASPMIKAQLDDAVEKFGDAEIHVPQRTQPVPVTQPEQVPVTRTGFATDSSGSTTRVVQTQMEARDVNTGKPYPSTVYLDQSQLGALRQHPDGTMVNQITGELVKDHDKPDNPIIGPVMVKNPNAGQPVRDSAGNVQTRVQVVQAPQTVKLRDYMESARRAPISFDQTQGRGTPGGGPEPPPPFGDEGGGPGF
jgi:hypothetical protein